MGTICSGKPAARACASSTVRRTPCIATRSIASFTVVSNAATAPGYCWLRRCSAHALSFPELHERRIFIKSSYRQIDWQIRDHRLADSLEHLWVQYARERVGGACESRAGGDEVPAVQQVHAAVAHRRYR